MTSSTSSASSIDEQVAGLRAWIGKCAGGEVLRAERHTGGKHRIAWQIDVANESEMPQALFLTLDAPGAGGDSGNARDATVLTALRDTPVPVPRVLGRNGPGGALLMERIDGRSDTPAGDDLEPVMADLMQHMATLHKLEARQLSLPDFSLPRHPEDLALAQLEPLEVSYRATPAAQHPLVDFGLSWLRRRVPHFEGAFALVHGDIGPGNMIYEERRVRAIVDWEISHWGDPMEDLATLNVRDMAAPIGSLPRRLRQYQAAGGIRVDADRLRYYRALVLIRNSLLICLTLANTPEHELPPQLGTFALLLRRAATQALCEASGLSFPDPPTASASAPVELPTAPLDDDARWIPALAKLALADCSLQAERMGPLIDRFLQPVPQS